MKKLLVPAMLAVAVMASQAFAQTTTDSGAAGRSTSASDTNGSAAERSAGAARSGEVGRSNQSSVGSSGRDTGLQNDAQRSPAASQSTGVASQGGHGDMLTQHIAACLALGNQEEIALAEFAQDRAQHPAVKQFAQMMVQEHQKAVSKLQQAAPNAASMNLQLSAHAGNASTNAQNNAVGNAQTAAAGQANQRSTATQGGGQHDQMMQLAGEVKQKCLDLTAAEPGQKQGADFDKAYIGQQIVAHTQMLAQLQTYQPHASNELKPIIQEGTQMTEHHLAQARQIMEQLSAGEAGGAPRNSQPNTSAQPRS